MAKPLATTAVISIGQMGLGIARLLQANNYRVVTNVSDRSEATQDRAASAGIVLFNTDEELVAQADYVLSIVPPRDAIATAKRIEAALRNAKRETRLYYLDLNAISTATARSIHASFTKHAPNVRFIDGGIIGAPPAPSTTEASGWTRPGVPLSGPYPLTEAPVSGAHLAEALNSRYLDTTIGSASGLKCCFAALTKGFTALALQSYTTASSLNVLGPLQDYLDTYIPGTRQRAEKGIVGCTSKAYRWVEEMNQIGQTFAEEGGFREQARVFRQIADVYEGLADVAEQNDLKELKAEDVVVVLGKDLKEK